MRHIFFLLLCAALVLSGCGIHSEPPASTCPETTAAAPTVPTTTPDTIPVTEPEEIRFHIPDLSVEDVILYFNEVCLDAEFSDSGNPSLLQKWDSPIHYRIQGSPTETDLEVLDRFTQWLNTMEGFPGIHPTDDPIAANLNIHFCTQAEMVSLLGENFQYMDGGVTFWYMDNRIYDAIICLRSDLSQEVRNSVILEELYNGLGPVQDTSLRPDSIIYAGYSEPQNLTPIDRLLLQLLYHPKLSCGMDAEACAQVIRQLYD